MAAIDDVRSDRRIVYANSVRSVSMAIFVLNRLLAHTTPLALTQTYDPVGQAELCACFHVSKASVGPHEHVAPVILAPGIF